jgi:hypothetical protein
VNYPEHDMMLVGNDGDRCMEDQTSPPVVTDAAEPRGRLVRGEVSLAGVLDGEDDRVGPEVVNVGETNIWRNY